MSKVTGTVLTPTPTPTDEQQFDDALLGVVVSRRRRERLLSWSLRAVVFVVFSLLWWSLSATGLVNVNFVSTPWDVTVRIGEMLVDPEVWYEIGHTFQAALLALAIGTALGVSCGLLFHRVRVLAKALNPFITLFNALPRPALAPLFILWFGLGITAKIIVGVSIVFFILLLNTMAGMAMVDPDIRLLTDSLGPSRWQRFIHVELPTALPSIVAGLRLGAVYSVLGVVVSEIVAAYHGLGVLMVRAANSFDITGSMAVLVLMAVCAMILDFAVRLVQRRVGSADTRLL
ncbi:ABC transporter permease [Micromonospora sp. NPDC051196]|uniref:ABC transporter permease n=1 Tax=Micromonospora sp. NPDC051196 TaxID=3155281 RepID=UPI0034312E25